MEDHSFDSIYPFVAILRKHVQQVPLTPQEQALLDDWLAQSEHNRLLFAQLTDEEKLAGTLIQLQQTDTSEQLKVFKRRITNKRRVRYIRQWSSIAAIFILTLGIVFWLYNQDRTHVQLTSEYGDDVLPGTNRAILTLSSGNTITLDEEKAGIVSTESGILYEDGHEISQTDEAQYATLSTPRGGQYKLTLPDGSKIWLNASSSLEYPLHFTAKERTISLKGEAYFEVSSDEARPFIVTTSQQQVNVLGTAFNIKAYGRYEATTLIQGKVAVAKPDGQNERRLLPSQQALVYDQRITVRSVDPLDHIAWRDGVLAGSPVGFTEVAADIERWYDVDFVYPANFQNSEKAYINIDRTEKLSSVLKALEHTYQVKFQIRGKEVIIR